MPPSSRTLRRPRGDWLFAVLVVVAAVLAVLPRAHAAAQTTTALQDGDVDVLVQPVDNRLLGSGTCLFTPDDLSAMLHQWQQGDFSTPDVAAGTCQGTYFGT